MKLIIIDGPVKSGKTLIANGLLSFLNNKAVLLTKYSTLAAMSGYIDENLPSTIIIDDLKNIKEEMLDFLKNKATEIKTINITVELK